MTVRAAKYARISQTDERVPKVDNQLADLDALIARRGYADAGTYADDGISAANGDERPAWSRLLADLADDRLDVIVATEEARLVRNNLEKAGLAAACARAGKRWETIRDGAVDPATASGEFMAIIRGAV